MRRLRIVTTVFFVFGIAAFLTYPISVGRAPDKSETLKVRKSYALKLTVYMAVVSFSLLGAAIGAILIARRTRREFAERSLENLAELITADVEAKPNRDE